MTPTHLARLSFALVVAMAVASTAHGAEAARPLTYDRPMEHVDLEGRSTEELRSMRDAIHARAASPAKLSPVDEKNLARIKRWEPMAKARADLRALVPSWGATIKLPPRADCEADAKGVLSDRKLARRLATLQGRLTWAEVDPYDDRPWPESITKKVQVRLSCWSDLDGDGAPESIVWLRHDHGEPHGGSVARVFLVSGKGPAWRPIAPLGVDGTSPGVEGSSSTNVRAVRLADGRLALAVETVTGGGGDCDQPFEKVAVFTLKESKLIPVASFTTNGPTCVD